MAGMTLLEAALITLQADGHSVSQSDIPGLWVIDGRELTQGQVIDYARQQRANLMTERH